MLVSVQGGSLAVGLMVGPRGPTARTATHDGTARRRNPPQKHQTDTHQQTQPPKTHDAPTPTPDPQDGQANAETHAETDTGAEAPHASHPSADDQRRDEPHDTHTADTPDKPDSRPKPAQKSQPARGTPHTAPEGPQAQSPLPERSLEVSGTGTGMLEMLDLTGHKARHGPG